jgi:divalent metal cation (Fe/Co/Zn/Cd) transporter
VLGPHHHHHEVDHPHSHGLVDPAIVRSRAGIRSVAVSLGVLGLTAAIFVSACVAGVFAVEKIVSPHAPQHLLTLGIAGAIGFLGNEVAGQVRLRAGRLDSPALVADGYHARTDGLVSLGVMLSAALVALGLPIADPVIAIAITGGILRITWQSWLTVSGRRTH